MTGAELLVNIIDELNRAKEYIAKMSDHSSNSILEDELVNDIENDLERYYEYSDSFKEVLTDIKIKEGEENG